MDYQVFASKADAQAEIAQMQGWDRVRAVRVNLPDHPQADKTGHVWVVQATLGRSDPLYLREDGYVR